MEFDPNSEFVCNDINGNSKWYFKDATYFRMYSNGDYTYLGGKYLADPEAIEAKGKTPQSATIALWNHWQKQPKE